ncbi:TPA: DNA polymerase III subunit theta [Proteus mirabilis]
MPVVASEAERQQPAHLRTYFNERLAFCFIVREVRNCRMENRCSI